MLATKPNTYRWTVEAALLPLQFAMGLNFFGPSAIFALMMDSLHMNRGTISLLMTAATVVMTLLLIPAGILVSRLGTKKSLLLAGGLMGLGILGGFSPSFPLLIALRVAFGAGASLLFPAGSTTLLQWFSTKELPLVNGLNLAAGGLGVATGMFAGVPIAERWGWEGVFFAYGAITLAGAAGWAFFGKQVEADRGSSGMLSWPSLLAVLRDRNTLVLAVAGMAPQALFVAYNSWLPTYYHQTFDMSLERGTTLVTIIPLVGMAANITGGLLIARVGLRKPFLLVPCILFPVIAFGTFYANNLPLIVLSVLALGITSSVFLSALFTIPMELPGIDTQRVGLAIAVVLTLGNVATAISPWAVGVSTDRLGSYLPSMAALALLPLTSVAVGAFLPETGPKAAAPRERHKIPVDAPVTRH